MLSCQTYFRQIHQRPNMSSSNNINPFANIKFQSSLTISPPSQHKADTNQAKASTIAENGQLNNYG